MSSVLFEGCASSGVKYCIGIVFDVNFFLSPLLTAILGIYYIVHLFFLQYSTGNAVSSTVHRTIHDLLSYDARPHIVRCTGCKALIRNRRKAEKDLSRLPLKQRKAKGRPFYFAGASKKPPVRSERITVSPSTAANPFRGLTYR